MKVLVLTTMVPFVRGGAELLRDELVTRLRSNGVEAEAMSVPFTWDPMERLIEEMLIARSLRITNVDRVIALKFPAYLVPHHQKVVWLLHQFRQAYDLREAGQSNIPNTPRGDEIQDFIAQADTRAFSESRALFASSEVTSARLRRYNGLDAAVLPAPLLDPRLFAGGESGNYIVATGRVSEGKRQHLLLEALRYAPSTRLIIAGPPESKEYADKLHAIVGQNGLGDRVRLDLRFLSRAELAALVNGSLAVACLPFDEDTMSYVAMEAFHAGKPVLTVHDAGGVLNIVHDRETGWVAEPTPEGVGAALSAIVAQPQEATVRGSAGRALLHARQITWPATIAKLLA